MLKRLMESFKNRKKAGRDFVTVYKFIIALFILDFIFSYFFSQRLIYYLYGYDTALMTAISNEAYEAENATKPAGMLVRYQFIGVTYLCCVFSAVAIYLRLYLNSCTVLLFGFTSLLLLLFFLVFWFGPFQLD